MGDCIVYDRLPELVKAAQNRLSAWGLRPHHKIAILANTKSYRPTVDAFMSAAMSLGTEPVLVIRPHAKPFRDIPELAEIALSSADFVVDLQHLTWFYSQSCANVLLALQKRGGFYAATGGQAEDVDTIIANPITPAKVVRARQVVQMVDRAREIRITSALGTDLRVQRGNPSELPSYTTDIFGQVAFATPEQGVDGVVQFTGPVRIQAPTPETFMVRLPVRMEFKAGRLVSIDRSTSEGAYLDDWFRSFDHPAAMEFAHINIGLVPLSINNIDNESIHFAYGGILMGIGRQGTPVFNTPVVDLPCHIDMHLLKVSYYADDLAIIKDGQFTAESGLQFEPGEVAQ